MSKPEFDNYSASYQDPLKDCIRDGFAGNSLFFHVRKRDLVREYFRNSGVDAKRLRYPDVGCGKGELLWLPGGDRRGPSKLTRISCTGKVFVCVPVCVYGLC